MNAPAKEPIIGQNKSTNAKASVSKAVIVVPTIAGTAAIAKGEKIKVTRPMNKNKDFFIYNTSVKLNKVKKLTQIDRDKTNGITDSKGTDCIADKRLYI